VDLWPLAFVVLAALLPSEPAEESPPDARADAVLTMALFSLAFVLLSALVILARTNADLRDLGVDFQKLGSDLKLGVVAFVMLAPPVYAIQWWLSQQFESKHPLVELLRERPSAWLIAAFAALIAAPVAEEYLFRVLLQGWLEKAAVYQGPMRGLLLGGASPRPRPAGDEAGEGAAAGGPVADDATGQSGAEAAGPSADQEDNSLGPWRAAPAEDARRGDGGGALPSAWPILASAACFAVVHIGHGPDWVALFAFALGLGYLYQRTHRILPCILVHFLLNSCSLTFLLVEVLQQAD
jgi:membrane protease YdiL (CAAX protease family)